MFPTRVVCELLSQPFKRSQLGLFQGKTKQYGNNVPFSKHKTRRSWLPNVQSKRLPSNVMGQNIKVKLTTRALKTISKMGGIDNYLSRTSGELLGHKGMELRIQMQDKIREKQAETDPFWKRMKLWNELFTAANAKADPRTLRDIVDPQNPSMKTARLARVMAQKALKKKTIASMEETQAYLANTRQYILNANASLL